MTVARTDRVARDDELDGAAVALPFERLLILAHDVFLPLTEAKADLDGQATTKRSSWHETRRPVSRKLSWPRTRRSEAGALRVVTLSGAGQHVRSAAVEERLLAWYGLNKRDLPWRRTSDPYAVLVSEVMLQQTQVDRVIPRYLGWLERWPTANALAEATSGDVIRAWQGLGYNRRALALHQAAQVIAAAGWPDDLTSLPGVGAYTAAAIRNFAFGEDVLPRDVNVDRVERRTGNAFTSEAAQALMDLGATICLARIPRCEACPLAGDCPSRGVRDEPARKQERFEGSFRQRRSETLRAVAASPAARGELDGEAVDALVRDGLVVVSADGTVNLP